MFDIRMIAIPIGIAAILLAQLILRLRPSSVRKKKPSLPGYGYRLAYSDKKTGEKSPEVLYSTLLVDKRNGLHGKPDMIFTNGRQWVPVELKSGKIGSRTAPYPGDLMQLAVYFLLTEATFGVRPKRGRLIYGDWMFIVKNNRALRRQLFTVTAAMRDMLETGEALAEPSYKKCMHCLCRGTVCEPENNDR